MDSPVPRTPMSVLSPRTADEDWNLVLPIRYPSFAEVHRTLTEESIGSFVSCLRDETIERSRFIVTTELPPR